MEDEFDILAAKVLAGEATEAERSQLQSMLANSQELKAEFAALQMTWNSLRKTAPVFQAETAPPEEIPAGRLRQLQQVVRDARQPSPSAQSNRHRNEGPAGLFLADIFRHWRERWNGAVAGTVSVALIALLVGTFSWLNRSATPRSSAGNSTSPVAHLLVLQGRPEVRRDGQLLSAATAFTLRDGDKVHLPPGTEASVVTPGGDVSLQGPKTTTALELAVAGASNRRTNQMGQASGLHTALFQPAPDLLKAGLLVTTRSVQTIPLYSPVGATAHLTPVILWKAEPAKTYDLRLTDEFDSSTPPWTLSAATSPVEFAKVEAWKGRPLAANGLYRLRISESGRALTTCEYTFRTVKEERASSPNATTANPLHEALQILTATPSRVGDALAILLTLPSDLAGSELALRIKLMAFGQLGYQADFEEVTSALRPIP